MVIYPSAQSNTQMRLRIVAAPPSGPSQSPTYVEPRMFVRGAGAAGLAINAKQTTHLEALVMDNVLPNAGGNAAYVGADGSQASSAAFRRGLRPVLVQSAILPADGASLAPTALAAGAASVPTMGWTKFALVAGGLFVGWLVFA
jgi:hypothetical protein